MNKPKYTFLLPAFKARYFEEALRSIKNQTYKDFNVLVSDDCSPEDLKSIYDKVVTNDDENWSYRRNAENMGSKSLVSHWNLLVDMCDTEYVIMASDDDVYEPNFLEEINKLTEKYPEVDLFRGRASVIDGNGKNVRIDPVICEKQSLDEHLLVKYSNHNYVRCVANFVVKKERLLRENKFVDFPLACFSDDAMMMLCGKTTCICNSPTVIFSFRASHINLSGQITKQIAIKRLDATVQFYEWNKLQHFMDSDDSYCTHENIKGLRNHVWEHYLLHYHYISLYELPSMIIWGIRNDFLIKLRDILKFLYRYFKPLPY